jgi:hypothetical protein
MELRMDEREERIVRVALASIPGVGTKTHGLTKMREYHIWATMKERCQAKDTYTTKHYGDKGVKVCERWANDFVAFILDMGPCPSPKHEIDRIDSDGDYEPENCRWVTKSEQNKNRRLAKKTGRYKVTIFGREQFLWDVCKELEINYDAVRARLELGWSLDDAINTPVKRHKKTDDVEIKRSSSWMTTIRDRR